jgi:hypothetical protein
MIIGVLNQKGGVGKTTIAINLAAVYAETSRVLLVDADPQASSLAWSSARERDPLFPVVGMAKPSLHRDLPDIARDYDMVLIDGAPPVERSQQSFRISIPVLFQHRPGRLLSRKANAARSCATRGRLLAAVAAPSWARLSSEKKSRRRRVRFLLRIGG